MQFFLHVTSAEHHFSSFKCGFLNIFRAKTCCVVCHAYCVWYDGTNKYGAKKPHSIRLLRWFNLSQSGSRKTIEKPLNFDGANNVAISGCYFQWFKKTCRSNLQFFQKYLQPNSTANVTQSSITLLSWQPKGHLVLFPVRTGITLDRIAWCNFP